MNNFDPIKHNLQLIYQPLEGLPFKGTYLGIFEMPQTENRRHKVECNHLSAILHNISRAVIDTYGTQVWKGITGPVDGVGYWLLALALAWCRWSATGRLLLRFHDRKVHSISVSGRQHFHLRSECAHYSGFGSCSNFILQLSRTGETPWITLDHL